MLFARVHGGGCCGVYHIATFPPAPKGSAVAIPPSYDAEGRYNPERTDLLSRWCVSDKAILPTEGWPPETNVARFDRIVKFLKGKREYGIIEIVLAEGPFKKQLAVWRGIVEERGFKEVSSCYNSNSCNRVHVFHLVLDKPEDTEA